MKTIRLFGDLALFKPIWSLDVKTPAEALRAIAVQRDGFLAACDAGDYVVILHDLDNPDLTRQVHNLNAADPWGNEELWVVPRIGGNGEAIVAAIAGAAFAATTAGIVIAVVINIAISIAISAIANVITGKKKNTTATQLERPDSKPSFIANGAVNVTAAGHPYPIIAGHVKDCGSIVLSSNYWVEDVPV